MGGVRHSGASHPLTLPVDRLSVDLVFPLSPSLSHSIHMMRNFSISCCIYPEIHVPASRSVLAHTFVGEQLQSLIERLDGARSHS